MDRVLPSEGRGCWFDPSRAHQQHEHRHAELIWPRYALIWILMTMCAIGIRAEVPSPPGFWQTLSDTTGKPEAIVEIFESGGKFHGRIVRLLDDEPGSVCTQCTGVRKGQPLVGMVVLTGLISDGDEYTGGEILDPDDGRTYRAKIKLMDGGDTLKVRGFLGLSIFGRTQIWLRSK